MGNASPQADPSLLSADPTYQYLQALSAHQPQASNQDILNAMARLLNPQPDPVSRIPMANMILPLMGGGMQMGSTAEAPPLSPEQSKMGVAQSAQFQPVADVAGLMAGSMRQPVGQEVLASERGAVGSKVTSLTERLPKKALPGEIGSEEYGQKILSLPKEQYDKLWSEYQSRISSAEQAVMRETHSIDELVADDFKRRFGSLNPEDAYEQGRKEGHKQWELGREGNVRDIHDLSREDMGQIFADRAKARMQKFLQEQYEYYKNMGYKPHTELHPDKLKAAEQELNRVHSAGIELPK